MLLKKNRRHSQLSVLVFGIAGLFILTACNPAEKLLRQLQVKKPTAHIEQVKISGLSLSQVDLLFLIGVDNPNGLDIHLTGLDYKLLLNGVSFLTGHKTDNLQIAANGKAHIQIPLSLSYMEIRKALKIFSNKEAIPFQLNLKIGVRLPVLGSVGVALTKKGSFPNLKSPFVALNGIKIDKIGFTKAKLILMIDLKNPNPFTFIVQNFTYRLEINGSNWAEVLLKQPLRIKEKKRQIINLPITLNFLEMGSAIYQRLTGNRQLDYHFFGKADFRSNVSFLKSFSVPFDQSGKIKLMK